MYTRLTIDHFRSFAQMEVDNLQRINIVTGKNGSGKTALLEAVFLNASATNTPQVGTINLYRGENFTNYLNDRPFRSLFYQLNTSTPVVISGQWRGADHALSEREVTIRPVPAQWKHNQTIPGIQDKLAGIEIIFQGHNPEKTDTSSLQWVEDVFMVMQGGMMPALPFGVPLKPPPPQQQVGYRLNHELAKINCIIRGYFVLANPKDIQGHIYQLLNEAAINKNLDKIVQFVQIIDRRLAKLDTLNENGSENVYVDIGLNQLTPLTLMGNGFVNLLHIACVIIQSDCKVVLIDEIESGLHHSFFYEVASALIKLCNMTDKQYFSSTHSKEFIDAFSDAAREVNFADLCTLHLFERDGAPHVTHFDRDDIASAKEINMEIR